MNMILINEKLGESYHIAHQIPKPAFVPLVNLHFSRYFVSLTIFHKAIQTINQKLVIISFEIIELPRN